MNKNYTIHMKEWHDVINDRGRTDMYHRAGGWGPSTPRPALDILFSSHPLTHTLCYHAHEVPLSRRGCQENRHYVR